MDFYKNAQEMEKQATRFYKDLAEKCVQNEGLKNILNLLVKDHEQHLDKFNLMEDDECTNLQETQAFDKTIDYFQNLQKQKETFSCNIDQLKMYKDAKELVQKKLNFYEKGMDMIDCDKNKQVLKEIIAEEKHHAFVLDNIIEMVNRPQTWIEDAEFYHMEEY